MYSRLSTVLASIAVLCAAGPVTAQDGPSFDCGKASGEVEEAVCDDPALATLDRRLADRFGGALDAAEGLDAGAEEAAQELRAYQRGWIKGRDECWKADDVKACIEDAYLTREGELVALWMLEAPMARTTWTCEDNPANEVAVWFFDTELPAIRIEYGDSVDAGHLVRAASGSRYAARFGREFWQKGDEALFTWEEGAPMTCRKAAG